VARKTTTEVVCTARRRIGEGRRGSGGYARRPACGRASSTSKLFVWSPNDKKFVETDLTIAP
jgi:hypothetical protein